MPRDQINQLYHTKGSKDINEICTNNDRDTLLHINHNLMRNSNDRSNHLLHQNNPEEQINNHNEDKNNHNSNKVHDKECKRKNTDNLDSKFKLDNHPNGDDESKYAIKENE